MANALYTPYKESLLGTDTHSRVDFDTDTIKIILVDTADYTFSAAHADLGDVTAGGIVSTATLASITTTGGALDSADPTFSSVTGDQAEAIIMYKDSGTGSTSPLVLYLDTASSGLPVTPNGGDISVTVNGSGWFSF